MSLNGTLALAGKCGAAAEKLSEGHGEFTLFSMIQRESTAGKWDVVASAPWLTIDTAGIRLMEAH